MQTVLVVCTANICRSPVMAAILRRDLDPARYRVESAGLRARPGLPVDSMVRLELARLGLEPGDDTSQPLFDDQIGRAGLVLTATRAHRADLLSREPQALRRTFTLVEFAALVADGVPPGVRDLTALGMDAARRRSSAPTRLDVPDPFGRSPQVHREVADLIVDRSTLVARVLNELPVPATP